MLELIQPSDLPIKLSEALQISKLELSQSRNTSKTSSQCHSHIGETTNNWPFVPGANCVRYHRGRSTEWFCETCKCFIVPNWVKKGQATFAVCISCFYNDLAVVGQDDIGEVIDNVEEHETVDTTAVLAVGAEN
jgi:hypothetical protein